mgnify:FL=1
MSPRPKGRSVRSDLRERILDAAWRQIAREGAPALALRAIARDLGIAAPSIYNHFSDRDALVTALILEAYESLGSHQLAVSEGLDPQDYKSRLYAIGRAYWDWALEYPQRYHLIFGTPIPGYVAPLELIAPVAARALTALNSVVEDASKAGQLKIEGLLDSSADHGSSEKIYLTAALLIWTRVHGLVSIEISKNFPPYSPGGEKLYQLEMNLIYDQFFK